MDHLTDASANRTFEVELHFSGKRLTGKVDSGLLAPSGEVPFVGVGRSTLEEGCDALQHPRFQNWNPVLSLRTMKAKNITPILNVSDMAASFAWFAKWGWGKLWNWGTPPRKTTRRDFSLHDPAPKKASARKSRVASLEMTDAF
jgi:hypothetical protein